VQDMKHSIEEYIVSTKLFTSSGSIRNHYFSLLFDVHQCPWCFLVY